MNKSARWALILTSILLAAGCSVSSGPGSTDSFSDRDSLSRTEILEAHVGTALDVVRKLRPMWLQKRGTVSINNPSEIAVYLDGVRAGGPGFLQTVPSNAVMSMKYIDASTATLRWGTNHVHGAIMVSTRQ